METPTLVVQYQGAVTIRNGEKLTHLPLISNDLHEAKQVVGRLFEGPSLTFALRLQPVTDCREGCERL
jgi:hypothetical protein